jgi:hypothetical protein
MEECLFRAVPLSLAALLGKRYGHRRAFVGIAVVVQALVFAGGHANYPGFPSYSRLVELFVPAVIWALIFLRFGLIPTILLHALFDLTLMSIPLFLIDAPGALVSRGLAIAAGLLPLAIIGAQRIARGSWGELPEKLRNGAWRAPVVDTPERAAERVPTGAEGAGHAARFRRALPAFGAAGLLAWALATPFRADAPALALTRGDAGRWRTPRSPRRGIVLEDPPGDGPRSCGSQPTIRALEGHKFVWREAGSEAYAKLIGNTLVPPMWEVRYATFEGDVTERAEEWQVTVDGRNAVRQIRHTLPESRPGARLARDDALALARAALRERLGLDPAALKDVASEEKQLPARADWTFTFADPAAIVGGDGEARIAVSVAGDEVAAYGRYVHVPEAWQRAERERGGATLFTRMALAALLGISGLVALVMAVIDWTHRRCDARALVGVALIVFVLSAVGAANSWPVLAMSFNTTEPIATQVAFGAAAALAGGLVAALLLGLAAVGRPCRRPRAPRPLASRVPDWVAGVAAACFVAGVSAIRGSPAAQIGSGWPVRCRVARAAVARRRSSPACARFTPSASRSSCCTGSRN